MSSDHLDDSPPSARATVMDRHVGVRIRERRTTLGISQQQLAAEIGVTYQQAQKYERGQNRISAGRLHEIASALSMPITWFFEGDGEGSAASAPAPARNYLELARNFAIIDERHQQALSNLARVLARPPDAKG